MTVGFHHSAAAPTPMVSGFRITLTTAGDGTPVCRPEGELDAYTIPAFRQAIADAARQPWLVVDLSRVPFVDSAGLGALIGAIRRLRELGGDATLVAGRPVLERLLAQTGFDRITTVAADADRAAAALRRTPAPGGAAGAGVAVVERIPA